MTALILLALALSMDAFAAALSQGAAGGSAFRVGAAFGIAQGTMPLLGWTAGLAFASMLSAVDHWVALILLGLIGLKMLREALKGGDAEPGTRRLAGWALFSAAIATSVDAAAAGVTLPTIGTPLLLSVAVIGMTTAALSYGGVKAGRAAGARLGKTAEIAGGLLLIGIGIKIFAQHQFFGA